MATSGTVGATVTDVTTILEHAFRRTGVPSSQITAEMQLSAAESLYFLCSDLANRGVSLWCVQKQLVAPLQGQPLYTLHAGTVDVLTALWRTLQFVTGTNAIAGSTAAVTFSAATSVTSMGLTCAAGTNTLVTEYSLDGGTTWTTTNTVAAFTSAAGQLVWVDTESAVAAANWRVRETVAASIGVTAVLWGNSPQEITMAKLNRDEYNALPNKAFSSTNALQYWYDKQRTAPRIALWPVPSDSTHVVSLSTQRHIQDVGALTNELDVPNRWLESIIFSLAHRVCMELPADKLIPGRLEYLEGQSEKHLLRAEDGERDGSPIRLMPRISGYTRR